MSQKADSSLALVAQIEREIEAMLAVGRRQAEDIRRQAQREASDLVRKERASFAAAEEAVATDVLAGGRERLRRLKAENTAGLAAIEARIEARMPDAVRAVVEMVTEGHPQ